MLEGDFENLQQQITNVNLLSNRLKALVQPFLVDQLSKKEVIELCHVAKLVLSLGPEAEILKKRESPDFIITDGTRNVGLEVGRILGDDAKHVQSLKQLFDKAAIAFKEQHSSENMLITFYLKNNFTFKKSEQHDLIKEIVNYVYGEITQTKCEKPEFIDCMFKMPHSDVAFDYNPGPFVVRQLTEPILLKAISKKEKKVEGYIQNTGIENQWLLVVCGAASPDSYDVQELVIQTKIITKFEHVYLLDDFKNRLIQVV